MEDKLWCKYYKPCGEIGWKSCKLHEMYDCSYEGDFNQCNMKRSILEMEREMTETKIKEMLSDIINNGAEYECRPLCGECDYRRKNCDDTCTMTDRLWNPYHLGEEVRSDYEYRKVIKYVVVMVNNKYAIYNKSLFGNNDVKIYFESKSEEKCKKWIEEHASWIEKNYGKEDWITDNVEDVDANEIRISAISEFVKEFLSRVYKDAKEYNDETLSIEDLEKIIKEIGVKLG